MRNPRIPFIDLSIAMSAPERVLPGQRVRYNLSFYNPGPDFAEYVQFVDEVPTNMTFYALKQVSGPEFECITPAIGETGRIVCTTKGLNVEETVQFAGYYVVDRDIREGTVFSSQSQVSSNTTELRKGNNVTKTEKIFPLPDEDGEEIEP